MATFNNKIDLNERYGFNGSTRSFQFTRYPPTVAKRSPKDHLLSFRDFFKSVFLPQGYPESVSKDYLEYQLWDTLQAFCSSITGMLAMQAILKGYGVGDQTATAVGATLTWMMKDGTGMLGRIGFAWVKGTQLDCDAKRWRLFADLLNDFAMFLELLAPFFKPFFTILVCMASISKSIVGVAGGATRAALTQHQARRDNMADVSAKDGSQETLVNLMALLAGFIITPLVADNQRLVWFLFLVFTVLHLFANYMAVSAVVMETINLPRLNILLMELVKYGRILTPRDVAQRDPVLRGPGYTRWIKIGTSLTNFLSDSMSEGAFCPEKRKSHIMAVTPKSKYGFSGNLCIALHKNCTNDALFKSGIAAILLDAVMEGRIVMDSICSTYVLRASALRLLCHLYSSESNKDMTKMIELADEASEQIFPSFARELEDSGWIVSKTYFGQDEWRFTWPEDKFYKKEM